MYLQVAPG